MGKATIGGRHRLKKKNKPKFITRSKAVRFLQVPLYFFRHLCILKGIYPKEPKKRKSGKLTYSFRDIRLLKQDPLVETYHDYVSWIKKLRKATDKEEPGRQENLIKWQKPTYDYDHLVRERYGSFREALRDLGDCLSLLFMAKNFPATFSLNRELLADVKRYCEEFMTYVQRKRCLEKAFVSIKGIYFEIKIQGESIVFVTPYNFGFSDFKDRDDSRTNAKMEIFKSFIQFYNTVMKFVVFRLYSYDLKIPYPLQGSQKRKVFPESFFFHRIISISPDNNKSTSIPIPPPPSEGIQKTQIIKVRENEVSEEKKNEDEDEDDDDEEEDDIFDLSKVSFDDEEEDEEMKSKIRKVQKISKQIHHMFETGSSQMIDMFPTQQPSPSPPLKRKKKKKKKSDGDGSVLKISHDTWEGQENLSDLLPTTQQKQKMEDEDEEEYEDTFGVSIPKVVSGSAFDNQQQFQGKDIFKMFTFYFSSECLVGPLEFISSCFGCQNIRIFRPSMSMKSEEIENFTVGKVIVFLERENMQIPSSLLHGRIEYVHPQWIFDCVNTRRVLPYDQYRYTLYVNQEEDDDEDEEVVVMDSGTKRMFNVRFKIEGLPPHLSPFVDYGKMKKNNEYVPQYAEELFIRGEKKKKLKGDEVEEEEEEDEEDLQKKEEEEGIDFLQKKKKDEEKEMEVEELRYQEELEKEKEGMGYEEYVSRKQQEEKEKVEKEVLEKGVTVEEEEEEVEYLEDMEFRKMILPASGRRKVKGLMFKRKAKEEKRRDLMRKRAEFEKKEKLRKLKKDSKEEDAEKEKMKRIIRPTDFGTSSSKVVVQQKDGGDGGTTTTADVSSNIVFNEDGIEESSDDNNVTGKKRKRDAVEEKKNESEQKDPKKRKID